MRCVTVGTLADVVVGLHLAFVVFVIGGGLLVLRWPRVAWAHVPAAAWGAIVEFTGWPCPLTPLENWLRERAGSSGYSGDFVARYLMPALYPAELTRELQIVLGLAVIALNVAVYTVSIRSARWRYNKKAHRDDSRWA
jgi:hypothetical protein